MNKWMLSLAFASLGSVATAGTLQSMSMTARLKLADAVQERMEAPSPIPAIVLMKEQATLPKFAEGTPKAKRNAEVVKVLWDKAKVDQASLADFLSKQEGIKFRQFYIFNGIAVFNPTPELLAQIAERDDVSKVHYNPTVKQDVPQAGEEIAELITSFMLAEPVHGIRHAKAPFLWDKGIRGKGITVGIQDTGVEWTHPALKNAYRGFDGENVDHNYNWHDSIHFALDRRKGDCDYNSKELCDDNNHGTHVTGTILGGDGVMNQIGMAPDAKWIGCRNMHNGNGTPATYIECYEYFLAPYPAGTLPLDDFSNLRPDLSADVISNSWGCPKSEGCDKDDMLLAVKALKAAGIVNVLSAGNEGPRCSTIKAQAATLSKYSFTVGALDARKNKIAWFSSRGPSTFDGATGPDVVAPGVNVRSAVRGGRYNGTYSGTSMAAPHVAGLFALALSANPAIGGDMELLEEAVRMSAKPIFAKSFCEQGETSLSLPNNTYGHGSIDAEKLSKVLAL